MAKKKKTRKQKALSDLRHSSTSPKRDTSSSHAIKEADPNPKSSMFTYSLQSQHVKTATASKTMVLSENHFITHDLKKTALLTLAIIASQLVLFWFLNYM